MSRYHFKNVKTADEVIAEREEGLLLNPICIDEIIVEEIINNLLKERDKRMKLSNKMNYADKVFEMLGVKPGEKFYVCALKKNVKFPEDTVLYFTPTLKIFHTNSDGLPQIVGLDIRDILCGDFKIIKIPKEIKPTKEEQLAIETFGEDSQIDMAIEEMSELTKALLKYRRAIKNGKTETIELRKIVAKHDVSEEMADVSIMLEQLYLIFDNRESVEAFVEAKTIRLEERIKNETDNQRDTAEQQ